jgi:hypothetical protein
VAGKTARSGSHIARAKGLTWHVRLAPNGPLPAAVVRKLAKARIAQIEAAQARPGT